jgi:ubiquinone/menaquinone biosynthesis C-methylase UbiE
LRPCNPGDLTKLSQEYALPIDDDELDRLDLNHTKYQLMYGGKLFLAPIPDDPQKVLDVGCGTGM